MLKLLNHVKLPFWLMSSGFRKDVARYTLTYRGGVINPMLAIAALRPRQSPRSPCPGRRRGADVGQKLDLTNKWGAWWGSVDMCSHIYIYMNYIWLYKLINFKWVSNYDSYIGIMLGIYWYYYRVLKCVNQPKNIQTLGGNTLHE